MNGTEFKKVFSLPFDEASSFFRDKLNIPTLAWNELDGAAHAKAFTSAGAYHADLLADLRTMTDKAIAGGMDIREFRKQFRPLVARYGWQLKGGGPSWRSDLIWRTNISTAYQAGRWQQFEDGGIEHLKYVHNDGVMNPRPKHVAMDGKILPRDDPFWDVNYPPNGWGCKCRAVTATPKEYRDAPKTDTTRPANWQDMPEAGWNYNVGKSGQEQGYKALTEKFESLPNDIAREWMQRFVEEPAFARFIAEKITGEFPVAVLNPVDMGVLGTEKQTVWLSDDTLTRHLERHPDIGLADYRLLPEIVDKGEVYVYGDERLILLKRAEKTYRAALKTTKSRDKNYLLTLFSTTEVAADDDVARKYERVR